MPTKAKIAKAKLAALIAEQFRDAKSTCVFPERITPKKAERPSCITPSEYAQLLLELGKLSRDQIAGIMGITSACVSQHRWNAHKKLGPKFSAQWKKVCKTFKAVHLSFLPTLDSPLASQGGGGEEDPFPLSS
jgi:hypothetical protein